MHEHLESVTYEENGEEITYAEPTKEDNPYYRQPIAGFRGPDQTTRIEEWMHRWSEASGDRKERERLMEQADIQMPSDELKLYLDYSIPRSQIDLKSLKIPTK